MGNHEYRAAEGPHKGSVARSPATYSNVLDKEAHEQCTQEEVQHLAVAVGDVRRQGEEKQQVERIQQTALAIGE